MFKYLAFAGAMLLGSCDQHRNPVPADDEIANSDMRAKAAGAKAAQDAVLLTRIDTLDARVSRLDADIAALQARSAGVDDLSRAENAMDRPQPTPAGSPPVLKYQGVGGSP